MGLNKGQTNSGSFKKGQTPWHKGNKTLGNCLNCNKEIRIFKSNPQKYCSHICQFKYEWNKFNKPSRHVNESYFRIYNKGKRTYEHRLIWMDENSREIPEGYVIHHINFDCLDNRPENLQLMTMGEHISLHYKIQLSLNPERKYFGKNKHLCGGGSN